MVERINIRPELTPAKPSAPAAKRPQQGSGAAAAAASASGGEMAPRANRDATAMVAKSLFMTP